VLLANQELVMAQVDLVQGMVLALLLLVQEALEPLD
jgi:hypothetical protein